MGDLNIIHLLDMGGNIPKAQTHTIQTDNLGRHVVRKKDVYKRQDVCYTVGAKVKNMSEAPLTRAEDTKKWNQGIYDLSVSLIASKSADNSLNGKKFAYALRAKDACGNDIISRCV